jgi:ABC-type amino acid transport system permease subunit
VLCVSTVTASKRTTHHLASLFCSDRIFLQAALCCEPLPAAAREALAGGLQALPQRQLEAALGLVLPRLMAAGESHLQQHSKAGGVSGGN